MTIPVEKKLRIVLSVLKGEISIAEAARREKVSEQAIGNWKRQFLEGGRAGIEAGKSKPTSREQQLEAEVAELTQALGEAAVEIRVRNEERGGSPGPFQDLEVIRVGAGMSTVRFCRVIDMPERTWRRWQAKAKRAEPPKGRWPQPVRQAARPLVNKHALAKPEWGHRKIWAMTRHDGHKVSQATVLRLLRDDGLILPSEYTKQRRELAKDRKAVFAKPPTGPNRVWQLDLARVRDHLGWDLADRGVPGLVLKIRASLAYLADCEPA